MKSLRTGPGLGNKENDVNYIKIKDQETKGRQENTTDWRGYDTLRSKFSKFTKRVKGANLGEPPETQEICTQDFF